MVKEPSKYASTGGWGFAHFNDGKPASEAVHNTCFACHKVAKLATSSSPVTHLDTENARRSDHAANRSEDFGASMRTSAERSRLVAFEQCAQTQTYQSL